MKKYIFGALAIFIVALAIVAGIAYVNRPKTANFATNVIRYHGKTYRDLNNNYVQQGDGKGFAPSADPAKQVGYTLIKEGEIKGQGNLELLKIDGNSRFILSTIADDNGSSGSLLSDVKIKTLAQAVKLMNPTKVFHSDATDNEINPFSIKKSQQILIELQQMMKTSPKTVAVTWKNSESLELDNANQLLEIDLDVHIEKSGKTMIYYQDDNSNNVGWEVSGDLSKNLV
ncbi:hypothetical protein ACFO26_03195 [Lactococcus nasutitermitis]|uniref:Uncharacterized protein n=1 Tax=Lactococcus nasutitermitis TaxID=1652957 RepID=A0ABV9JBL2_9LACT|nr:hypothetical protein [Lactococcus nasutitermitis]